MIILLRILAISSITSTTAESPILTLEVANLNFRIRGFGCTGGNTTAIHGAKTTKNQTSLVR